MHTKRSRNEEIRDDIAAALAVARDLGPDYDPQVAESLMDRVPALVADPAEPAPASAPTGWASALSQQPGSRAARVAQSVVWWTLGMGAATLASAFAPSGIPWGLLAVIAVTAHVAPAWRNPEATSRRASRAAAVTGGGALVLAATAWIAETAPEGVPWIVLTVLAVVAHVVRASLPLRHS
ncbi:hypothetical protein CLV63_116163 [Murinocardiopsis flavida]|uniref:Uncharacterized protein n=1 Tax=Murinocardiopsis flavida TaxID=645275 RepID=A0A2P8D958_9ACTN|nr:hypothetical protein [Murinocardiopsis flavida]PSK93756.1 hypothetical protein CLV63_116163 [Murinocardiopsis flavida]